MPSRADDEARLTAEPWNPSALFEAAEGRAVRIAKLLRANRTRLEARLGRASVDDAIALAEAIITLSGYGRRQSAHEADQAADMVEILLDRLHGELEGLTETK